MMVGSVRGLLLALLTAAVVALPTVVGAQSHELTIDNVDATEYPVVEITVTVPEALADAQLSKEPFSVVEDGRQVQPYLGSSQDAEDPPAPTVALAIDTSGSMDESMEEARTAAGNFVASLPTDSRVGVVTFGDRAEVLVKPTANLSSVQSAIASIPEPNDDNTALFAGIREAADLLHVREGETGTVVVLSDGDNNVGDNVRGAAMAALNERDASLWAVELGDDVEHATLVDLVGDEERVLTADDASDLEAVYSGLASSLARQYVLRYESTADGRTDLMVSLDYDSVRAQRQFEADIEAASGGDAQPPSVAAVDSDSFVVTVPLLGTIGAYVTGVAALAVGAFILLLFMLTPRSVAPRERLLVGRQQSSERPVARLTSIAQWTTDVADRRLRRGNLGARLDRALESAGLNIRPGELVVIVGSLMIVLYAVGLVVGNAVAGLVLALLVPLSGRVWLGTRRDKRQAAFAEQLTDVLQLIGSSLRAGYGLVQGIDAVSHDADEPSASEFRRIVVEHRLGRDLNEAMDNCAARMANEDFSWVVQAIGIHRDVGGDLAKVLDNIISTIRDRADVHRQVRSLSAEGRLSARILIALPLLVLTFLVVMNPEYLEPMIGNALGWALFGLAGVLITAGALVTRRLANIKY